MTKAELEIFLHEQIPLAQCMDISVKRLNDSGVILTAPLSKNKNDKNTGFAGALATLTTLSGWALATYIAEHLAKLSRDEFTVVASKSEIQYLKPVTTNLIAHCEIPKQEVITAFLGWLEKRGKARIHLSSQVVCDDGAVAVQFSGDFVVIRK